jgi:hypothetical protein
MRRWLRSGRIRELFLGGSKSFPSLVMAFLMFHYWQKMGFCCQSCIIQHIL